jgi:hypothetical protein
MALTTQSPSPTFEDWQRIIWPLARLAKPLRGLSDVAFAATRIQNHEDANFRLSLEPVARERVEPAARVGRREGRRWVQSRNTHSS